jgi:hypothetical protein
MRRWKRIRWLALIALGAAAAIAANVALLDVAERRDDPVGKLSRRILIATNDQDQPPAQPATGASTDPGATDNPEPPASTDADGATGGETDDGRAEDAHEPSETDDD